MNILIYLCILFCAALICLGGLFYVRGSVLGLLSTIFAFTVCAVWGLFLGGRL